MFDTLFGYDIPLPAQMLIAFVVVFGLIALLWWIARRLLSGSGLSVGGARGRQQRLAVIDAHPVDARRKLVLVRRDNVEHLLMIGGPNDVVVESTILRARPLSRPAAAAPQPEAVAEAPRPAVAPLVVPAMVAPEPPPAVPLDSPQPRAADMESPPVERPPEPRPAPAVDLPAWLTRKEEMPAASPTAEAPVIAAPPPDLATPEPAAGTVEPPVTTAVEPAPVIAEPAARLVDAESPPRPEKRPSRAFDFALRRLPRFSAPPAAPVSKTEPVPPPAAPEPPVEPELAPPPAPPALFNEQEFEAALLAEPTPAPEAAPPVPMPVEPTPAQPVAPEPVAKVEAPRRPGERPPLKIPTFTLPEIRPIKRQEPPPAAEPAKPAPPPPAPDPFASLEEEMANLLGRVPPPKP